MDRKPAQRVLRVVDLLVNGQVVEGAVGLAQVVREIDAKRDQPCPRQSVGDGSDVRLVAVPAKSMHDQNAREGTIAIGDMQCAGHLPAGTVLEAYPHLL